MPYFEQEVCCRRQTDSQIQRRTGVCQKQLSGGNPAVQGELPVFAEFTDAFHLGSTNIKNLLTTDAEPIGPELVLLQAQALRTSQSTQELMHNACREA
jgi:hypothetical protein